MNALSLKAYRFMEANRESPVVYFGLDDHACVYRLSDGSIWRLSIRESQCVGIPRFSHLLDQQHVLDTHRGEEMDLIAKLELEAQQASPLA